MKPLNFTFKALFLGFLVLLGIMTPFLGLGAIEPFVDDFETYNYGDLNNQGGWNCSSMYDVVSNPTHTGNKAVKMDYPNWWNWVMCDKTTWDPEPEGVSTFWFWTDGTSNSEPTYSATQVSIRGFTGGGQYGTLTFFINKENNNLKLQYNVGPPNYTFITLSENLPLNTWHSITMEWSVSQNRWRLKFDQNDFTDWISAGNLTGGAKGWHIENQQLTFAFDDLGLAPPTELNIKGIAPNSGTTITDLDDEITIQYSGFDWNIYDGFIVNFRDNKISALGKSIQFLKSDLSPTGNGTKVIKLRDFGINSNGIWYLTALGFGKHLDIQGGMYLTTRGYIDFWTDELVVPPYYLIFNVEGLPTPYTFTEPEDWYSTNVERFNEPTAFFSTFVGLISPIFEKVGEFGVRVQSMFDKNQAYDRGYALGEVFPLINGYIQKIDLFFGGFPLASFFKYLILTMLAIFIIRTLMKFIPFFG
jgi:hypothetical protein